MSKSRDDHKLGFGGLGNKAKDKSIFGANIKTGKTPAILGSILNPIRAANKVSGQQPSGNNNTNAGKVINNTGVSGTSGLSTIAAAGKAQNDATNSAKTNKDGWTIWPEFSSNSAKGALSGNKLDPYLSMNLSGEVYEDIQNKNNMISVLMNRENNKFNAAQAEAQRQYETQMANTAHQREVQDLQAAGLNPVLSAGGTGAITPNGASAGASNFTGVDNSLVNALAGLASTAISANATMSAAATSAAAQRDAASMTAGAAVAAAAQSAQAVMYSADQNRQASILNSFISGNTGRYSADKSQENALLGLLKFK